MNIRRMWARVIVLALILPVLISDAYGGLRLRSFSTSSLLKFTVYLFAMMLTVANTSISLPKTCLTKVGSRRALLLFPSHPKPCVRLSPHTATQCVN
ncbi:hypothetical protein, partial [Nostoc sp.]|uniref:hypothetical protein n=1 Tax=Nostoc sp. TaxID=1180 RepID=UPI002FF607B0